MNYETATVAEIAAHFKTISRQRIHQLMSNVCNKRKPGVVEKMAAAVKQNREDKYVEKHGCTRAQRRRCDTLWNGLKLRVGKASAYLDCTIAFKNEREFRAWAFQQVGFNEPDFELDKDILVKGNRVYGPDTCAFLPTEVNLLFSGCYKARKRGIYPIGVSYNKGSGTFIAQMSKDRAVSLDKYLGSFKTVEEAFLCYKQAKEAKIKRMAEKWKDRIDSRVYKALMERTVEWDD